MEVLLDGKLIRLDPNQVIGQGSEAYVYGVGKRAIKIFKEPNHPDFAGSKSEQDAARMRLAEHQKKLRIFPNNLPSGVIVPEALVTNKTGTKIVGYAMRRIENGERLVRYSDQTFRRNGVDGNQVVSIFQNLHRSVQGLHQKAVVIGDFKNLNVLVVGSETYLIDSDSFQFGGYLCTMYSDLFLDPLLADPNESRITLVKPYNPEADWYAFNVMLLESLLYVHPFYGGVFRPAKGRQIPRETRPLRRISVFNPEVIYPKPAVPLGFLPDDLLQYFEKVFVKDQRGEFPEKFLANLRWTKCLGCGVEHARNVCPNCQLSTTRVTQVTRIVGKVVVNRLFQTDGTILKTSVQEGKLLYLYNEGDKFFREGRRLVLNGKLDSRLTYQLTSRKTLFGQGNQVAVVEDGKIENLFTETIANSPVTACFDENIFWTQDGELKKQGQYGPVHWGDVLRNQSQIWLGQNFGFGFYRAGGVEVYFIFDATRPGIRDDIKLPSISGELIEVDVVFSEKYCWLLLAVQEKVARVHFCYQISSSGEVVASTKAEKGDGSWLGEIKGKAVIQGMLFVPTDEGIVRVEAVGSSLEKTAEFADTEPFVDSGSQLLVGEGGLFVVNNQEIWHLKIS